MNILQTFSIEKASVVRSWDGEDRWKGLLAEQDGGGPGVGGLSGYSCLEYMTSREILLSVYENFKRRNFRRKSCTYYLEKSPL